MKLNSVALVLISPACLNSDGDPSTYIITTRNCLISIGAKLKKISIVEDDEGIITQEIDCLQKLYDILLVVTMKFDLVSRALASVSSQELSMEINGKYWPQSVKVLPSSSIMYLQRIFVISSKDMEEQLEALKLHLQHYFEEPKFEKSFFVNLNGSKKHLDAINKDNFTISFQRISSNNSTDSGVLTVTSKDFQSTIKGELILKEILGTNIHSSTWRNHLEDLIYQSPDKHIQHSIQLIEKCLDKYGVDNIFLSFNGGKDCTVLLHLIKTVLGRRNSHRKLFCLYVRGDNVFKEQDDFIEQCMIFYDLEVMSINAYIKDALKITVGRRPNLKACFMGSRRTDPYCANLDYFQMTDADWPQVMRCSPFLDWHFTDIWDYLLYFHVPYCKLYDYGYTSLGSATNTIRNPNLSIMDSDQPSHLPAYKLLNEKNERSGRSVSKM